MYPSPPSPIPLPPAAEGVLYAEKDFNLPKHPEIDVPNLEVIKLMQSFKSKEYVTERYAWRHFYWCAARCWGWRNISICIVPLWPVFGLKPEP